MNIDNSSIKLSAQRALIGTITENIRSIQFTHDGKSILLHYYYNKPPRDFEIDLEGDVCTEIAADFPGIEAIDAKSLVVPFPQDIPRNGLSLYRVYEGEIY